MTLDQITELFKWMTLINIGILIFSAIILVLLKDIVAKFHGKLFGIGPEAIALITYGYLGLLKVLILVFNIAPYLALEILH